MQFTREHDEIRATVRRFIEAEINPHVAQWEADGRFPAHELFRKFGALGLLGIHKPAEFGGLGLDYSYHAAFLEELGHCRCSGLIMGTTVQTDMATPALARFGSDALRHEFLAPAIRGEMVASIAVSEPGAGSDVAAIRTHARRDGGDYVINGSKMWITNSTQADFLCLLAVTGGESAHRNKSLIIVPTRTRGITFSKPIDKLGMRASDTAQIFLEDVRVPLRHCIGTEGEGFVMQMKQFQEERVGAALSNLRTLENCILDTIEYTRARIAFGKPLLDNQVIHFRLAELQTEIEALRALCWRAVEEFVAGRDMTTLASMAKLKYGRLCREVTDACLQYWGGMGFTWDNYVSRLYRDLRLVSIGGGADEVMLQIICKAMGTLPRHP
ncbi:MAG: acyl-CoA dehydrogenase family protein [Gammaproteobacteria bacterium]